MTTLVKVFLMGVGFAWVLRGLVAPLMAHTDPLILRSLGLAGVCVAWLGGMIVGAQCLRSRV